MAWRPDGTLDMKLTTGTAQRAPYSGRLLCIRLLPVGSRGVPGRRRPSQPFLVCSEPFTNVKDAASVASGLILDNAVCCTGAELPDPATGQPAILHLQPLSCLAYYLDPCSF